MSEFLSLYLLVCGFFVFYFERTLVSYFIYFSSVYSYISLIIFDFGYVVPFGLGEGLSKELITFPIFIFSSCAVAFSVGQNIKLKKCSDLKNAYNLNPVLISNKNKIKSNYFALFPIFTTIMVVSSVGFDNLLYRSSYVVYDANLTFRKYADITVWLAIIAIPFIKNKFLMFTCHVVILLSFIGLGSRSAMVVALSYPIFNYYINNSGRLKFLLNFVFACFISVAVMNIRFSTYKGLIPVFTDLINFNVNMDITLFLVNYLSSYSVLLFSEYLYSHVVDYRYFLMSVSPLPGYLVDIDGIDQWARFRKSIPHSAFSQLYGHVGLVFTIVFFIFHGFICGYFKNRILRTYGRGKMIMSSLPVIDLIFLIPVIRGMQYNLRGVSRLEYLVMAITLFFILAMYIIRISRNNKKKLSR